MHSLNPRHTPTFSIWIGYIFFVVYGSLVPLDFKPLPLEQAWTVFQHIPMYKLGVESRADWIANGVLYVPVGFLTAHLLIQKISGARRYPLILFAGLFSVVLAFSVEFTQIFFPPRTVSRNDLLAETIGILVGLMLASRYSEWFRTLLQTMFGAPGRLTLPLLGAYLFGYIAFSLFPYDILLSGAELEQKYRGEGWGWLLAGDPDGKFLIALKSLSEIILTIPFGLFLGYRSVSRVAKYKKATLWGVLLGSLIEIAQFFTASGVSQGLSVLMRIFGVCAGVALWHRRENWSPERVAGLAQRYVFPLGTIYFLVLLQVNGWFSHRWNGFESAASQLDELHFIPFYYHYFTTEAKALVSAAFVCFAYSPIGLATWARRGSPTQAFFVALFVASLVETGKLFLQGLHADPTNIMLGAIASWGALHLANVLSAPIAIPSIPVSAQPQASLILSGSSTPPEVAGEPARRWVSYAVLFPSLAFSAYWAVSFPTQPVLLFLFLSVCAAIIWHRPTLLFAIIPAALPVFDLAPWSGRFYLDEFDLLVLVSLVIGYNRIPPVLSAKERTDTLQVLVSGLVAASFVIGAMRGLSPWQTADANAFTNYYSPFNALRIFKGALWAFLTYGLLRRLVATGINVQKPLGWGLVTSLFLTVAVALWERVSFVGLFNFSSDYRITGPFSSMHTGGANIECFLALATPFLVLLILQTRKWISRLLGVFLLVATTYALMVTFSRNGYFAFGIALAIILFFAAFKSGRWQQRSLLVVTLSGVILAVALPVFTGQFAQDRIATVGKDYVVREAHWDDALDIRDPNLLTTLFGMGLGRYPETHYLLSREDSHSGTYRLISEGQNIFLRLVPGSPIYIEQLVSVQPQQKYVLKFDARANGHNASITTPLCEKWLLAWYDCQWSTIDIGKGRGEWQQFEVQLSTDTFSVSPWYSRRPIKLGLHNGNNKAIIDMDNVRLETIQGEDLLINGNFSKEMDNWFFSADSHLQWHAKSLPVAVLFDQGWFGLLTLSMFSILAIKRAAGRAWRGDLSAAAVLASFSSFLVVGLFDTLIDAPRFLFIFLLLGWFCHLKTSQTPENRKIPDSRNTRHR